MDANATNPPTASDPTRGTPHTPAMPGRAHAPQHRVDLWRTAHRALRGRYRLALLIAGAGAAAGALVGTMVGQRLYSATGMVRVASVLPQVMRETNQNRPIAMFDGFLQAQKEVMTSREVIETAIKDPAWQPLAGAAPSAEQFASRLKVETKPRSDHLRVTFTHKSPAVAGAAVRSIISAYQQAFTREQQRVEQQRTGQLTARRATLTEQLKALDTEIGPSARGHTASELEALYTVAADRLKKMRAALVDVQCAMAGGPEIRGDSSSLEPAEIVDQEILRSCAAEQARAETQLVQARARGLTDAHPSVIRLQALIRACHERVDRYTTAYDARRSLRAPGGAMSLADREASLRRLTQTAEDELKQLTTERAQLAVYEEKAGAIRQGLTETDSRIEALATEASLGSRLTIVTTGEKPLTALVDNRAKTAGLGTITGAGCTLGALVVAGTRRRRYRFCDEVAADLLPRLPFVAVLPELTGDPALSAAAAHGVHELRVRLQPAPGAGPRTYLVASATPGAGNSGVAVSLALSFAAAGFRTLLIDGDLDSHRLTHAFNAADSPGLLEAVAGGEPHIRRVRAGLSVLTVGGARREDACRLAPDATGRVISGLRERFDIVLIDSDPILTGLAASVFAPRVDAVILTLAREQEESPIHRALAQLSHLGVVPCGAVFNRADPADGHAASHAPGPAVEPRPLADRLHRFGPLVGAVLSSLALSREDDMDLISTGVALARTDREQRAVA